MISSKLVNHKELEWYEMLRALRNQFVDFNMYYLSPDSFDVSLGKRIINYKVYIQKLELISETYNRFLDLSLLEILQESYKISPREETVKVFVDISRLFDKQVLERLLRGERAENIVRIPKDVSRELTIIADNIVNKLLQDLNIKASKEFKHALREWVKLWIHSFYGTIGENSSEDNM